MFLASPPLLPSQPPFLQTCSSHLGLTHLALSHLSLLRPLQWSGTHLGACMGEGGAAAMEAESSVHLSVHPPIHPLMHPSIHLFICPSVHPFTCSSIHPSVHPFVHPSFPSWALTP